MLKHDNFEPQRTLSMFTVSPSLPTSSRSLNCQVSSAESLPRQSYAASALLSLEELVISLGPDAKSNLATLLAKAPAYFGCDRIRYQFALENPPFDPTADHQFVIAIPGSDRIATLVGLRSEVPDLRVRAFANLVQAQELGLQETTRHSDIQEYTSALYDPCPLGIVISDTRGCLLSVNRAFVAMTRRPQGTFIGVRPTKLAKQEGRIKFFKAVRELQTQKRVGFSMELQLGNGRSLPVSATITAFEFKGETLFLTTLQDLSYLEAREQEFVKVENQLNYSIKMATDCFLTFDHSGRITEANPYTGCLLGMSSERCAGRPIDELFTTPSLREFRKALNRAHKEGYASLNCGLSHTDGSEVQARGALMRFELDGQLHFRLILQATPSLQEVA